MEKCKKNQNRTLLNYPNDLDKIEKKNCELTQPKEIKRENDKESNIILEGRAPSNPLRHHHPFHKKYQPDLGETKP